ncbi:hypothetical protein [Catellatospora methionotrophica]|uniref:hypothetical protein n=1 Tax=Catellatospora methionotrophica TaxID=121620 RepID=UPI0033D67E1A
MRTTVYADAAARAAVLAQRTSDAAVTALCQGCGSLAFVGVKAVVERSPADVTGG